MMLLVIAFGVLVGSMTTAMAQAYPSRPITIIVPFPPGGNTDIMARALQVEISKSLRQTIIINNKSGASGTLGIRDFVKAEPDGYTLALTPNNTLTAQPHLQKLPYGVDSFRYVCLTYYTPYVLIAAPQAPFKTFDEFVKFARAKSENLVYATAGPGTTPHLVMLNVLKAIGATGLAVPFQGEGPDRHRGAHEAAGRHHAARRCGNLPIRRARRKERRSTARRGDHGLRRERRGVAGLSRELQTRLTRSRLDRRAQHSLRLPVPRR
jgi:tripartite-type tricarboxylate transporter receptor subunit TctC